MNPSPAETTRLKDLSPQQWKSGLAAWLGWLFDGLDMHLYTLVATPFVAQLLTVPERHENVGYYGSVIQAAFLTGWALGGGFFGRIGDRLGRARTLMLTILTYALFTGLSVFAQAWWHLMIFRFLAALGIGGEWAVGAALLAESWPKRWRPWLAAVLQSAVNVGIMIAMAAGFLMAGLAPRYLFLVGVVPALIVLWIRRAVPETEEWRQARFSSLPSHLGRGAGGEGQGPGVRVGCQERLSPKANLPRLRDLFRGSVLPVTALTILVCAFSLTGHWAFMYWFNQHLHNLPDLATWDESQKMQLKSLVMILLMITSILGNFFAGAVARGIGYRRTIFGMFLAYFLFMLATYAVERPYHQLLWFFFPIGACSGAFALFTMYLPPLFPTLLRTTGAGFCYNIGRLIAAAGTIYFGFFSQHGDHRLALLYSGLLFLPAAVVALFLPNPIDQ